MTRSMNFDVTSSGNVEEEFRQYANDVNTFTRKLRELGRVEAKPKVTMNLTPANRKLTQLDTRLAALQDVKAKLEIEGATEARTEVTGLVVELRKIKDIKAKIELEGLAAATTDVSSIETKLRAISDKSVSLEVKTGQSEQRITSIDTRLGALRLLSPVKIEVKVDEDDRAMTRIQALILAARGLGSQRPRIQATADTATANAQLAALLAQVRSLSNAEHTVRVRLEGQSLLAQLSTIQTQLNTLAGGSVDITADTRALMTQLAEARVELARLEAMDPTVVVEADTALARHRIELLERQLHDIAAEQYHADVDVDRKGTALGKLVALSGASGLLVASLGSSTAAAVSLAGSLVAVGGAAPVAVGGLMAVVGVVGAYKLGVQGLDEALTNLDDPEKLAEALARLSPNAREFVASVQKVRPAFDDMRLDVQQRLLAGMGDETERLGARLLPSLRTGLGGVATELNLGGKELVGWVTSAEGVRDVDAIFRNTNATVAAARPALTNVVAGLTDVGVVGSSVLPELVSGWEAASGRFRAYVASAEGQREVEAGMRRGIETVQTLGSVLGNVGGIAVGMYEAADASGADFLSTLDRVTGGVERYVRSADGQRALIDFFSESRDVVDELTPGIAALGTETGRAASAFSNTGGAERFASATSDILRTVSPLLPVLGELGGETLGNVASGLGLAADLTSPLVDGLGAILTFAGPVTPAVLAMMAAFGGGIAARAAVLGLSTAMSTAALNAGVMTEKMLGSAAAGTAVASAGSAGATGVAMLGKALPIAAVATVGLGMALDGMTTSTSEAAEVMRQGGAAADSMRETLTQQTGVVAGLNAALGGFFDVNALGIGTLESTAEAMRQQRAEMTGLELAQEAATIAQGDYARAVSTFTEDSPQARAALADLNAKTRDVDLAQRAARDGTDLHTAAMREQTDQALAAENASIGYRQSILDQRQAQTDLTVAVRDHGVGSDEAQRAQLRLEQADLRVIAASGALTQETRELEGSSLSAAGAAAIETSELLGMATSADGKASPALQRMAGRLSDAQIEASNAAVATSGFHYEVRTLPDGRRVNIAVDAETGEVVDLHSRIDNLPKAVALRFTASGEVKAPGYTGVATGGVWNGPGNVTRAATGTILPGYTPGRDVHDFRSPTGGRLLLSGGEPIMRPEVGRGMGPAWIHGMNRAARTGGVAGVQSYYARTAPRPGSVEGRAGDGSRFATGGLYGRPRVAPSWSTPRSMGPPPVRRFATGGVYESTPETATEMNRLITAEMARRMNEKIKAMYAAGSGPTTAGAAAALAWARRASPRPYGWGAVGPGAYDCSGAMSALVNVMRGRNPHSRVGGTGTFPWPGFKPGIGPGLSIGSFRGDPGHMAGTIGGVNIESSGSGGFRVGGTARGAGWHRFTTKAHLADRGGMFGHREAALNLSGRAERALTGRQNDSFERLTEWATSTRGQEYVRPRGPGSGGGPAAERARAVLAVARPASAGDGGRLAAQLSGLRAEFAGLRGSLTAVLDRDPLVLNQTIQTADPAEAGRLGYLNLRHGRR